MDFVLNGVKKQFDGDPKMRLLYYLREVEGIISPKNGCSPQGQEKQSFCMEENPAACPVSIFSKIDPTVPCDAVRQALDLAEDLSEDAIEHHKNEIARLQSTLRSLRSFRADTTKITAILSDCE